jgi:2-oxoisovalerate dehydrogenase E1 component alpha subunit
MKKHQKRFFSDEEIKTLRKKYRDETARGLQSAIEKKFPPYTELFTDVYDQMTPNLIEQLEELKEHLKTYGDKYNMERYHQK